MLEITSCVQILLSDYFLSKFTLAFCLRLYTLVWIKMDDILNSLVGDSRKAVPSVLKKLEADRSFLEDRVSHSFNQPAMITPLSVY